MEYNAWQELQKEMAIETIAMDLRDCYIGFGREAKENAKRFLENKDQTALNVEYRMGQAIIALESLGYKIIRQE